MAGFSISDILGAAPADAAGQAMEILQVPIGQLHASDENAIYRVDDVALLAASIQAQGLQQPLLIRKTETGDGYTVISGHRRLAAIASLREAGKPVFERVPCVLEKDTDAAANRLRLILANATCRELSDWERLEQYKALKEALTEAKKAGGAAGKVRDAVCEAMEISAGTAAKYEICLKYAENWVMQYLKNGQYTLSDVYGRADHQRQFLERQKKAIEEENRREEQAAQAIRDGIAAGIPQHFTDAQVLQELLYGFCLKEDEQQESMKKQLDAEVLAGRSGFSKLVDILKSYALRDWPLEKAGSLRGEIPDGRMYVTKRDVMLTGDGYAEKHLTYKAAAHALIGAMRWEAPPVPIDFSQAGQIPLPDETQRKYFLECCEQWPLLAEIPELEMRIYLYVLPDGRRLTATRTIGEWKYGDEAGRRSPQVGLRLQDGGERYPKYETPTDNILDALRKFKEV